MRRFAIVFLLALGLLPASAAQAGFAPTNETIFESEQTSAPEIAIDAAGNSIVAWSDEKSLGDPREAKARRLSAGGTLGPTLELAPGEIGAQPAVAVTAAGRAFVAWESRVLATDPDSVKGRWVEPNGALGPLLTLATGQAGTFSASYVQVVIDPEGIATVSWQNAEDGGAIGVRRVLPNGALGAAKLDISGSAAPEHETVALPNGSTVAVWRGSGIETNTIDAALNFGVPVKISSLGLASDPAIAVDSLGNSLVVWQAPDGADWAPYGHRLGVTGAPTGTELTIDPPSAEFVGHVSVAADSSGDFVITWDRQNAKNEKAVLSRGAGNSGFAGPAQTLATAMVGSSSATPALFDNGAGAVAWRSGDSEVPDFAFGRPIDRTGSPSGPTQELFAYPSISTVSAAAAPAIGAAAFLMHYPISGSAQGAVVRRFLVPPTCADSSAATAQGKPVTTPLACGGAAIEAVQVLAHPRHGALSAVDPAGLSAVYTPRPGYTGADNFTYTAGNDGGSSAVARVTIRDTVKPKIKRLAVLKGKPYKVRLFLSEPARVKVTVNRLVRVGGKRQPRKIGVLTGRRPAARMTLKVRGRLARKLATGGRFRLVAVATDPAGFRSNQKKKSLRLRPR